MHSKVPPYNKSLTPLRCRASSALRLGVWERRSWRQKPTARLLRHLFSKGPDALNNRALEDAIHRHGEILDRLSNEMMAIKSRDIDAEAKRAELWRLRSLIEFHRDNPLADDVVERIAKLR